MKVKTFTQSLEIFKTTSELTELDGRVNEFVSTNDIKRVISVSDSTTAGTDGTIGIIRVVAYED